jgi:hypothetical protein
MCVGEQAWTQKCPATKETPLYKDVRARLRQLIAELTNDIARAPRRVRLKLFARSIDPTLL